MSWDITLKHLFDPYYWNCTSSKLATFDWRNFIRWINREKILDSGFITPIHRKYLDFRRLDIFAKKSLSVYSFIRMMFFFSFVRQLKRLLGIESNTVIAFSGIGQCQIFRISRFRDVAEKSRMGTKNYLISWLGNQCKHDACKNIMNRLIFMLNYYFKTQNNTGVKNIYVVWSKFSTFPYVHMYLWSLTILLSRLKDFMFIWWVEISLFEHFFFLSFFFSSSLICFAQIK